MQHASTSKKCTSARHTSVPDEAEVDVRQDSARQIERGPLRPVEPLALAVRVVRSRVKIDLLRVALDRGSAQPFDHLVRRHVVRLWLECGVDKVACPRIRREFAHPAQLYPERLVQLLVPRLHGQQQLMLWHGVLIAIPRQEPA
eukprot:6206898-Pleurochrysis_carterae.AAC.1